MSVVTQEQIQKFIEKHAAVFSAAYFAMTAEFEKAGLVYFQTKTNIYRMWFMMSQGFLQNGGIDVNEDNLEGASDLPEDSLKQEAEPAVEIPQSNIPTPLDEPEEPEEPEQEQQPPTDPRLART